MSEGSAALTPVVTVLAVVAIVGVTWLALVGWVGKSRRHTTETWACGIELEPSMSYSGTSLSHPLLLIFKPLFGTTQKTRIERHTVRFSLKIRQIFEKWLYQPIVRGTVFVSAHVRRIQDGSIHTYLAYIFMTLIVLLLLIPR